MRRYAGFRPAALLPLLISALFCGAAESGIVSEDENSLKFRQNDGTEVLLDQEQANVVNSFGVATWLNMNGFRLWGNNTACYPGNTDPKDRWINIRRFMNWAANTFILTYTPKIGQVMNRRLIESIVDSENIRGNSFVSRGICAAYSIAFMDADNPTTDLLNGKIVFRQRMTPFTPAEEIDDVIEFDPVALADALGG